MAIVLMTGATLGTRASLGSPDPGETRAEARVPKAGSTDTSRQQERDTMVRELTAYHAPKVTDARVLEVMAQVPRHRFVPRNARALAYRDTPLEIGYGQTISQPYIVALMTELAQVGPASRVLEIGTGSGYQTAVLAAMGAEVYTMEIVVPLARRVQGTFGELGITRVHGREGDGYYGWPEHAPYDRIVVTAAAEHIPPDLVRQLVPGGRMVIPVGNNWGTQELLLVTKDRAGKTRTRSLLPVRFVPLTGGPQD